MHLQSTEPEFESVNSSQIPHGTLGSRLEAGSTGGPVLTGEETVPPRRTAPWPKIGSKTKTQSLGLQKPCSGVFWLFLVFFAASMGSQGCREARRGGEGPVVFVEPATQAVISFEKEDCCNKTPQQSLC